MKKIAVLAGTFSLVFLTSVNASSMGKPAKCPSLALVKSVGIQHVDKSATGSDDWIAWSKSRYDTNDSWTFAFPILM